MRPPITRDGERPLHADPLQQARQLGEAPTDDHFIHVLGDIPVIRARRIR